MTQSTPHTREAPDDVPDVANLELIDITISFTRPGQEPLTILEGFNLDLAPGQLHCLAGRSGSGKTSLLRVAADLTRPQSGHVRWRGDPVHQMTDTQRADARRTSMGYADQNAPVIGELTALDNVLLPAIPTGLDTATIARARDLLEGFGLADHATDRASTLSGGERQRIALARAMLTGPTTLAADEPTASLDRASAATVIAALRRIANAGTTVLLASHDPHVITAADTTTSLD